MLAGMSWQAKLYLWVVVLWGLVPLGLYIPQLQSDQTQISLVLIAAILALLADLFEVEIALQRKMSTSEVIYCAVLFIAGPSVMIWSILLGTLSAEIVLRWHRLQKDPSYFFSRVAFNTSQFLISGWVAIGILRLLGEHHPPSYDSLSEILLLAFSYVGYTTTNTVLISGILTLTQRIKFTKLIVFKMRNLPFQVLALGIIAILIAVLYAQMPWQALLVLIPVVGVHLTLRGYTKLRQETRRTLETMVHMMHERDPYTAEHSEEVADLTEKIAREMELPEDHIETIRVAALVHDIGKIGIPEKILNKQGPLDASEWKLVKQHTIIGADLLKNLEMYSEAAHIVKYEHERWDGTGYPDGLKGEKIPIGARIIHVADVYHALTSDRVYRKSQGRPSHYEPVEAVRMIQGLSGRQFDPKVVEALVRIISDELKEPLWFFSGRFS
jgi:putative nucleotidyltransferase with HDIG domain